MKILVYVLPVPLSTKMKRFPATILLHKNKQNGLTQDSEILIFQMRVLAKSRLIRRIGTITQQELKLIVTKLNEIFEV